MLLLGRPFSVVNRVHDPPSNRPSPLLVPTHREPSGFSRITLTKFDSISGFSSGCAEGKSGQDSHDWPSNTFNPPPGRPEYSVPTNRRPSLKRAIALM